MEENQEFFVVSRLHRDDLLNWYSQKQIDSIPNDEMQDLAERLGSALLDSGWWECLKVLATESQILSINNDEDEE